MTEQRQDPRKVLEQTYDKRLDKLYTSVVKCPYCGNRIQKLQTVCTRCGLNKIQIAYASNVRAKEMMRAGERGKIVMMRRRPNDLNLLHISWRLLFGFFGVHNFYTGRKIRGWIMLGLGLGFILQLIIFPVGNIGSEAILEGMHPWRETVMVEWNMPFPLDFLGAAALVLWISDMLGVFCGWYKYPVRLGEVKDAANVWAK